MQLTEPSLYNPLALAFVGDAEYGLLVRKMLVSASNRHAGDLHRMAVKYECAPAQAKGAAAIVPLLSSPSPSALTVIFLQNIDKLAQA